MTDSVTSDDTVAERFQACTDATDRVWRKGFAECYGDEERRLWRVCFEGYVRGVPTPWLNQKRLMREE